jgi:phosphoglycolate phosphatase-like HAD superfamily hydrolase
MPIETVLLDIDGTLVDSNDAHARAWVDAFAEAGHPVSFDRVRPLIGMGGDKVLRIVADIDSESEAGKALSKARQTIFGARYLPVLQPTVGARQMVEWLIGRGITVGIATSANGDEVRGLLAAARVEDLIQYATSSQDADRSKPDPDIVVAALRRSQGSAATTVMIGDTPYDIEAARSAGVKAIAFRCGGWSDEDLRGAAALFNDPADFVTQVKESRFLM